MTQIRNYGWRPQLPDHRDYRFTVTPEILKTLPPKVDLRPTCPPVVDQGQLGSCFHGDTKIKLLNGKSLSIKELAEGKEGENFWVYSCDENNNIVPGRANAFLTKKNSKIIKITLDNGEIIKCTPDHKFMLRDGSFKEVENITNEESLMPLYTKYDKFGYELIFDNKDMKYHKTHNVVAYDLNIKQMNDIDEKIKCVHHVNFNKLDYKTIFNYFSSINELKDKVGLYNHKIISKEYIDEKFDVYDLEVEKYHNFALSAGIFVHNCTANAIAAAHRFNQIKEKATTNFEPSRLFIYYNERVIEGTVRQDAGAMIRDGIKVLNNFGACTETTWPYVISKYKTKPTVKAFKEALLHQSVKYQAVTQNLDQMKGTIASGFPFVYGFSVYQSFESATVAKTGIVPMPSNTDVLLGGHAVLCVGYDDTKQWFITMNSWGTEWGDKGYFYIPYSYLTNPNLASDFWVVQSVEI